MLPRRYSAQAGGPGDTQRKPGKGMTGSGWTTGALAARLSAMRLPPAPELLQGSLLQASLASVLCGLLVAWLIHRRYSRGTRIFGDNPQPVDSASDTAGDMPASTAQQVPAVIPPVADTATAPPGAEPAQGADLAARARFVAMSFAISETNASATPCPGWPLQVSCHPTRFTLTLRHAALRYRLEFCNRGAEALGPLVIRADLVAVETRIPQSRQVAFEPDALPLCHYVDSLAAGSSIELTGELHLPIARIAAMRLGMAELLVPLIRLCAESAGEDQPRVSVSACFAIGMPSEWAGDGIQPFRLDSGPGIWRKLAARRIIPTDLS